MVHKAQMSTDDADVARQVVTDAFCDHRLATVGRDSLRVRFRSSLLSTVGFSRLDYGSAVRIAAAPLKTFFLVQVPTSGHARISQGGTQLESTPDLASVLSPDAPADMYWYDHTPQSIFYADRTAVERELARLLGRPLDSPLMFDLGMNTRTPEARSWLRSVKFLRQEVEQGSPLLDDRRHIDQIERMVISQLLLTQHHNYSKALTLTAATSSCTIRLARELIEAHHQEPLTVVDMAEAVGVSVRTLQTNFVRELGVSPMAYLRELRLGAARTELKAASTDTTVTRVALNHGYSHFGRFSVEYKRRFGESPSATLRRA
jgi:AraC-like DNA-binding protein